MIIRQPNCKLCRINQYTDKLEVYNMSEDDFINLKIEEATEISITTAKEILKEYVRDELMLNSYKQSLSESILKEMNDTKNTIIKKTEAYKNECNKNI